MDFDLIECSRKIGSGWFILILAKGHEIEFDRPINLGNHKDISKRLRIYNEIRDQGLVYEGLIWALYYGWSISVKYVPGRVGSSYIRRIGLQLEAIMEE